MRVFVFMVVVMLSGLAGCRGLPPSVPVSGSRVPIEGAMGSEVAVVTEVGDAARKAAKGYSMCVWSAAEKMRLGSSDVRLVVETAEGTCKKNAQRLHAALEADRVDYAFARSYVDTIVENARTEALAQVLRANARETRAREARR
ncbi:hypothetical protein [Nitrosovibrio sp. Nv17]|uniref:hypothetical protein n=1 Tax=Nitrosovibrio sp. Nv17 TaxID=1855339 RepID=UPI0011604F4C|nr:hypothetical protein [Nitrosovibrio sp. Nv17]